MTGAPATRAWTTDERAALEAAALIRLAVARAGGALRPGVTVGHVRVGDDEFVRSLNGTNGAWYRAAIATGRGRIEVGALTIEVALVADAEHAAAVDAALRSRYGDDSGVRRMTAPLAREATLRIEPLRHPGNITDR
jgi:hypothetical protein